MTLFPAPALANLLVLKSQEGELPEQGGSLDVSGHSCISSPFSQDGNRTLGASAWSESQAFPLRHCLQPQALCAMDLRHLVAVL